MPKPSTARGLTLLLSCGSPCFSHVSSNSTSRKILRFVDKIAKSKYFQKATENEFIKKKIEEVSNTPLLLTVEVQELAGTLAVNIPPPPTDRVWYQLSFLPCGDTHASSFQLPLLPVAQPRSQLWGFVFIWGASKPGLFSQRESETSDSFLLVSTQAKTRSGDPELPLQPSHLLPGGRSLKPSSGATWAVPHIRDVMLSASFLSLCRYSFRVPPQLELKVRPKLGEREVTFLHVTEWIEKKLQHEFQVRSLLKGSANPAEAWASLRSGIIRPPFGPGLSL